jgi:hypothetical protein
MSDRNSDNRSRRFQTGRQLNETQAQRWYKPGKTTKAALKKSSPGQLESQAVLLRLFLIPPTSPVSILAISAERREKRASPVILAATP